MKSPITSLITDGLSATDSFDLNAPSQPAFAPEPRTAPEDQSTDQDRSAAAAEPVLPVSEAPYRLDTDPVLSQPLKGEPSVDEEPIADAPSQPSVSGSANENASVLDGATRIASDLADVTARVAEAPQLTEAEDSAGTPLASSTVIPDDPIYRYQWQLNNRSNPDVDLNVETVWDEYQGRGVKVGVVDDGIDTDHASLAANYRHDLDYDIIGRDGLAEAEGSDNHGTAVAGMIAGKIDGSGHVGAAPEAEIAGYRISYGANQQTSHIGDAFQQALANGMDVVNNSWGYGGMFGDRESSYAFRSSFAALEDLVEQGRDGLGTVVTFAAGNDRQQGQDTGFHGYQASPYVITVAAAESDGDIAYFSTPGASVLVAAPGRSVATTDRAGSAGYGSSDYASVSGTSFAAPAVAGVVALMLEANPMLGYRDVQEILAYSSNASVLNGPATLVTNGAATFNGGGLTSSRDFGFGMVDAHAAVRLAESWQTQQTFANQVETSATTSFGSVADGGMREMQFNLAAGVEVEHMALTFSGGSNSFGDLRFTLVSPSGTESVLIDRALNGGADRVVGQNTVTSVQFWGEESEGTWTLRIEDLSRNGVGASFGNVTLTAEGNASSNNDTYIFTDEFASLSGQDRSNISDTDGGVDTLNFAAMTGSVAVNLDNSYAWFGNEFLNLSGTFEKVITGDGNDDILGGAANEELMGMRGEDNLNGGAGDDILTGGQGHDHLLGGTGNDTAVYSGAYADYTITEEADGRVRVVDTAGTDGEDLLTDVEFLQFTDQLVTLADILGGDEPETPEEEARVAEDQKVLIAQGADVTADLTKVVGAAGTFTLVQGPANGSVTLNEDGTYTYVADRRADGEDSFTYRAETAEGPVVGTVSLNALSGRDKYRINGNDESQIIATSDVSTRVYARDGDDEVQGGNGYDRIYGQDGDDILFGNGRSDRLYGGNGNDVVDGGEGNDRLYGNNGDDVVRGGTGNDYAYGGAGNDQMFGGHGNDYLRGDDGVDLLDGGAGRDRLDGGRGDDVLNGGADRDYLYGRDGNDTLNGGTGDDRLYGYNDNDVLNGGDGRDYLYGHRGDDVLNGGAGDDRLYGGSGNNTMDGGDGRDYLYGSHGNDVLNGGAGDDRLYAGNGINTVFGGDGNDRIYGGRHADTVDGGAGNDYITTGSGNDILNGGAGVDRLYGGRGQDTYVIEQGGGMDRIQGYDFKDRDGDILSFGDGIGHDDLWFSRSGRDLEISVAGTGTGAVLTGWFSSSRADGSIETADGYRMEAADINKLVSVMASYDEPEASETSIDQSVLNNIRDDLNDVWSLS